MTTRWSPAPCVLLLATAVRVHDLSLGGLWLDEGYSLLQSERGFSDILALRRYDANPPLYLLMLHGWRALFGPSVLAAQAFSVALSICAAMNGSTGRIDPSAIPSEIIEAKRSETRFDCSTITWRICSGSAVSAVVRSRGP